MMDFNANKHIEIWKADKYLACLDVKMKSNEIKLISLDIFDTLVFRTCDSPSDVFTEVARRAAKEGVFKRDITEAEFISLRQLAEEKARVLKKNHSDGPEVQLKEIYNHIGRKIGELKRIRQIEFEVECDYCYLNPSIVSLIEDASSKNIRIALVSNMYFNEAEIKSILANSGLSLSLIDTIIVSSDYRVRKNDGQLFLKLMEQYPDIDVSKILHIGDNFHADVLGASSIGMKAIHYNVIGKDFTSTFEWEQIRHGILLSEISSLRKLASNIQYNSKDSFWFSLGAKLLGPFLTIFTEWIVELAIKEDRKEIYPLMREGSLLAKLIERSIKKRNLKIKVKPLFVSRQATFLAGLECINKDALNSFFERRNVTVEDLFTSLEMGHYLARFEKFKSEFLSKSHRISYNNKHSLKEELVQFFLQKKMSDEINNNIKKKRKLLIAYLQQTCTHIEHIVTVDIGFEGTIQSAIERALQIEGYQSNIIHLLAFGGEKNKYHLLNDIDIRGFGGNCGENSDLIKPIIRSSEVIEQLMMENYGSVLSYEENKHGIIPVLDQKGGLNTKEKQLLHQGVFLFQSIWFHLFRTKPLLLERLIVKKREWTKLIHRLIDMPDKEEASRLGDLLFDENFGSNCVTTFSTKEDDQLLTSLGIEQFLNIGGTGYRTHLISWPQAVVTRRYPTYLFEKWLQNNNTDNYLVHMLEIINCVKRHNYNEMIIYGAGEAGDALLKVAQMNNIQVNYIVDRKEALWGKQIGEVKVVSIDYVVKHSSTHVYGVGSFSFAKEIKSDILERYKNEPIKPIVYTAIK